MCVSLVVITKLSKQKWDGDKTLQEWGEERVLMYGSQ